MRSLERVMAARHRVAALLLIAATAPLAAQQAATPGSGNLKAAGIDHVVAAGTTIELLKSGLSGTEGPIALKDGSLLFTEREANRVTRIGVDGSFTPYLEDTEGVNSLTFDSRGHLLAVQWIKPRVVDLTTRPFTVLADAFNGVPLGRPNDLIADRKGGIYFSDPGLTAPGKPTLFYLNPRGQVVKLADDIERPNGVVLSPDESRLYVANTAGSFVLAYDVAADGTITNRRNFAPLAGVRTTDAGPNSGADGLAIDSDGRLYVASNPGIQVFAPDGTALGVIALPVAPQNLAFAGPDKKTLYVVGRGNAYRMAMLAQGFPGRAK